MSREWCDFVLNKPNRIWNWDDKLQRIQERVAKGMDEVRVDNLLQGVLEADKEELERLAKGMLTTADVNAMKRQRRFAKACEEALEKMFTEVAMKSAAMSTAGASMGIDTSNLMSKPMDMREFALLLAHLDVVPDKISKTDAQHIFMEAKESLAKSQSKELGYLHFKIAIKRVAQAANVSLPSALGVTEPKDKDAKFADVLEEKIVQDRDAYTVSERTGLKNILMELEGAMQLETHHTSPPVPSSILIFRV